jgi:ABC-type sugar transport system substrate-binding protein
MFRRVAITLAAAAAGALLTAGPVAAAPMDDDSGFAAKQSARAAFSYENLGGPWGITRAHGRFEESMGYLGRSDR